MTSRPPERAGRAPRGIAADRGAAPDASGALPHDAVRRAAVALWAMLALLVLARAALAFVPSMWLWSLNLQRFLAPVTGWGLWALAALALVPPLARAAFPALESLGGWLARSRAWGTLAAAALGGTLPWFFPDRVRYVGDFLLRQGTVEEGEKPSILFPQALPLDVLLHHRLPLALYDAALAIPNVSGRLLGTLEAALLASLALAFARALSLRGAALAAAAATVYFGGYLGLYTGYSKAFGELALLAVAVAAAGIAAIRAPVSAPGAPARGGRALLALGLAVALGATLHRSALGLLPAAALVFALWLRAHGGLAALRRPLAALALALPLVTLAAMLPRIVADVRRWDTMHFTPAEVTQGGGVLRSALAGTRPADLLNLLVLLSPLALPALAALLAAPRAVIRRRELGLLALLALPFVAVAPLIHPAQGLYRDWDDFATTGVAVSLIAAWVLGEALRGADGERAGAHGAASHAWIAVAAVLGVATPSTQWLAHHADHDRGLARVHAFVDETPARTPGERAKTWDYLGIVSFRRERWEESAEAFARAADTGPSPRILQSWAMAETNRGDLSGAQAIYHRLLATSPESPLAWLGLAAVSSRLAEAATNDSTRAARIAESRRAANELLRLEPENEDARGVLEYLDWLENRRLPNP